MSSRSKVAANSPVIDSLPVYESDSERDSSLSGPQECKIESAFYSSLGARSFPSVSVFAREVFSTTKLGPGTCELIFRQSISNLHTGELIALTFPILSHRAECQPIRVPIEMPFEPTEKTMLPRALVYVFDH